MFEYWCDCVRFNRHQHTVLFPSSARVMHLLHLCLLTRTRYKCAQPFLFSVNSRLHSPRPWTVSLQSHRRLCACIFNKLAQTKCMHALKLVEYTMATIVGGWKAYICTRPSVHNSLHGTAQRTTSWNMQLHNSAGGLQARNLPSKLASKTILQ